MRVFINNCFHWASFHITNYFLEKGYKVDGVYKENEKTKEHFMMFLGRNNNFSLIENTNTLHDEYELALSIGKCDLDVTCNKYVEIEIREHERVEQNRDAFNCNTSTIVYVPILFGEWMPMTEEGLYQNETFIRFDSDSFLKEAIYISRFIESLVQLLQSSKLPTFIEINSIEKKPSVRLENSVYLYTNRPKEYIRSIVNHYKTYSDIYKEIYNWTK